MLGRFNYFAPSYTFCHVVVKAILNVQMNEKNINIVDEKREELHMYTLYEGVMLLWQR